MASVDTSEAEKVCHALSRMSGTPMHTVALSETGRILAQCAKLTRRVKPERIKRNVEFQNRHLWTRSTSGRRNGAPIISGTKAGVSWFIDPSNAKPGRGNQPQGKKIGGKTFHAMTEFFHWSDERWARYQSALQKLRAKLKNLRAALAAQGLTAHSWWQCGVALGVTGFMQDVPQIVRRAVSSTGKTRIDGTGSASFGDGANAVLIEFRNSNPALIGALDGATILQKAIDGRVKYFNTSMQRAAFESADRASRAYKGVFITGTGSASSA